MTSNIGARQLKDFGTGVGFSTKAQKNQSEEIEKGIGGGGGGEESL